MIAASDDGRDAGSDAPVVVMVPGLEGTGELFGPFVDRRPGGVECIVVRFPSDRVLGFDEHVEVAAASVPEGRRVILLGESFGSLVATHVAAQRPEGVETLVLVNGFVRPPIHGAWSLLPFRWACRGAPPELFVRHFLVGRDAPSEMVSWIRAVDATVAPDVLASRIRQVFEVDAEDELLSFPGRVVYLRGIEDVLVRSESVATVRSLRPDVHVAWIDGPHVLLPCRPEACWGAFADAALADSALADPAVADPGIVDPGIVDSALASASGPGVDALAGACHAADSPS